MIYSPILCFGFDRPKHLNQMLESLEANNEAKFSDVYICIDGPAINTNSALHLETVEVANKNWKFNSIKPIIRNENLGCRTNIITTISQIFNDCDKLIILEDDLYLGPYFLKYMNDALNKYHLVDNIWHINGYTYPQINQKRGASIGRYISPWGWATWKFRWDSFIKQDFDKFNYISSLQDYKRKKFNVENLYDWENILIKNELGEISAWDAYWYQAIFLNNGLTVSPNKSHVRNLGFDGTGMHCSNNDDWKTPLNKVETLKFPTNISENKLFRINTLIFYKYYNFKRYVRYHKSKFENYENFRLFIKKKFKF